MATYLAGWDDLDQDTRTEILAFASQPDRGEHFEGPTSRTVGIANPAFPDCNVPRADGGFECNLTTEHFSIKYHISDDPDDTGDVPQVDALGEADVYCDALPPCDAGADGVPDLVNQIAGSLESAWRTYEEELGYPNRLGASQKAPVDIHDLPHDGGQVLTLPGQGPGGMHETIELDPVNTAPIYLARHELFHFFQYAYVDFNDLVELPVLELFTESKARWWLEATAEWAAHQAGVSAHLTDPLRVQQTTYDERIANYFRTVGLPIDRFGGETEGIEAREYGLFVLAEYLEERSRRGR